MKGVVVQRVDNAPYTGRSVDGDHGIADQVWHRRIESPVPIGNTKGRCSRLIFRSLRVRICLCNLLGVQPE